MRKLIGALLFTLLVGTQTIALANHPFSPHPILAETAWIADGMREDAELDEYGKEFVWRRLHFFMHHNGRYFMSRIEVFGKEVVRAYGVHDSEDRLVEHWFQINGHTFKANHSLWSKMYRSEGLVIQIEITDDNDKTLYWTEFSR